MPAPRLVLRTVLVLTIVSCTSLNVHSAPASPWLPADADTLPEPTAVTDAGWVQGKASATADVFLGIPYAQPPVHELRWKPTLPAVPWFPELYAATSEGPACPQASPCTLATQYCPTITSEDCLFVNVFAPRDQTQRGQWPVLVFVHGGGFASGQGGGEVHDGQYLANATASVVVTFNYRLGALGSISIPGNTGFGGNLGMQDQVMLLKWVRRNVRGFGGNRDRVTVWGQGSGALAVAALATNPSTFQLYHQLILSTTPYAMSFRNESVAEFMFNAFSEAAGCTESDLDCLLKLTTSQVIAAQVSASQHVPSINALARFDPWTPIAGASGALHQPIHSWLMGSVASVPMLVGYVANSSTVGIYTEFPSPVTQKSFNSVVERVFGAHNVAAIAHQYGAACAVADERGVLSRLFSDAITVCPSRNVSQVNAVHSPVFLYEFNHASSFASRAWGPNSTFCFNVTCAGSELPYLFHTASELFTSDEAALSAEIVSSWGNFLSAGDPSNEHLPSWTSVNTTSAAATMVFTTPSSSLSTAADASCDLWNAIGYGQAGK